MGDTIAQKIIKNHKTDYEKDNHFNCIGSSSAHICLCAGSDAVPQSGTFPRGKDQRSSCQTYPSGEGRHDDAWFKGSGETRYS